MILLNSTKDIIISSDVRPLKTLVEKSRGLIGSREPQAVFIKTRWGIHTFRMKFPIDVIVCDKDMRVSVIKENLLPNKMFFWNPKFQNIFEFPVGSIKNSNTEIGDILVVK